MSNFFNTENVMRTSKRLFIIFWRVFDKWKNILGLKHHALIRTAILLIYQQYLDWDLRLSDLLYLAAQTANNANNDTLCASQIAHGGFTQPDPFYF